MLIQGQAGALPSTRQSAGTPNVPAGSFGEILDSKLNPDFYQLTKGGRVYQAGVAAANPTAFTGGAAGTPLLGLFNPAASGIDLVIIQARLGVRTTGTAAGNVGFAFWGVNQGGVAVTGTQTAARNLYSLAATGGVGYAMANVVNTGALASALLAPSFCLGAVAASAAPTIAQFVDEIRGAIIVAPGCYLAFGSTSALTGASLDASLIWAEVPA
jgi:hypothetical protein